MTTEAKTVSILEYPDGVRVVYEDVADAKQAIRDGALTAVLVGPCTFVQRSEVNEPDLAAAANLHRLIGEVHADPTLTPAEKYAAGAPLLEAENRALGMRR